MTISGINSTGAIQNVYVYGNTHYNQVQDSAVSPVRRVKPAQGVEKQEEQLNVAVTYKQDQEQKTLDVDSVTKKEQVSLAKAYAQDDTVDYQVSNPYERSRMVMEGSLLTGMNLDVFA